MALDYDDKLRLTEGSGMWHTAATATGPASIHLADGPHGLRAQSEDIKQNNESVIATCFPTASAIAASFSEDAAACVGAGIAAEALLEEVSVVLGPGVNIKRSPLCGRNFEYYSEDPCLAGTLGAAFVKAVQNAGVGTSVKHFAGNNQETHRMTANSEIDERALREIYLAAFEQIVKEASPATIMASYNRINGTYACENHHLLTDILRKEWGFTGAVISDWGACLNLPSALAAGMDLEMPDGSALHLPTLHKALDEGSLSMEHVDNSNNHIINLVETYGPKAGKSQTGPGKTAVLNNNNGAARELASKTAVLLRNEGDVLPLRKGTKVIIIGELARKMRYQGGGSSHIHIVREPDFTRVMSMRSYPYIYARGYDSCRMGVNKKLLREALSIVRHNDDPILFFGGLTEWAEGEGYDRTSFDMPAAQLALLSELKEEIRKKPVERRNVVVFLSFGGAPYDLSPASYADAILHMYPAGQAMDDALSDLLFGSVSPSGRLPETWPKRLEDTPCYETYATGSDDVEYRESIFMGYRYYDTYNIEVQYPFGYGLSYSKFRCEDLKLSAPSYDGDGDFTVSFTVRNEGPMDADHVVCLYVRNPEDHFLRAKKELRAFKRVSLKASESTEVTLTLSARSFSIYDVITQNFVIPNGTYTIEIGSAYNDIALSATLPVNGVSYLVDDRIRYGEYFLPRHDYMESQPSVFHISSEQFAKLCGQPLSHLNDLKPGEFDTCCSVNQLARYTFSARILRSLVKIGIRFRLPHVKKQDPQYRMYLDSSLDGTLDSLMKNGGPSISRFAKYVLKRANRK